MAVGRMADSKRFLRFSQNGNTKEFHEPVLLNMLMWFRCCASKNDHQKVTVGRLTNNILK